MTLMRMRKIVFILWLLILISELFFPQVFFPQTKAQGSTSTEPTKPSTIDKFTVNWTDFWIKFRKHSRWSLEGNRGEGWEDANDYLKIIRDYPKNNTCKITLIFDAPVTADYRLTFAIDVRVKQYFHKEGCWNYTLKYENYTITFDWSDIKDIPNLNVTHGIKDGFFWFRIRRDNIPKGTHVKIDPTTVATSSTIAAVDYQEQRKTFYANGYFWVFYSDGTNLVYRTSTDGVSWSSATTVRACTHGEYFDVEYFPAYSTTYVYYAYAAGGNLIYRRGSISGSTINWGSEVTVNSGNVWYAPSVGVATDGRVFVGGSLSSGGNTYFYVWTNPNNDGSGSWSYTLLTWGGGTDAWRSDILQLTSGRVYVLFCKSTTLYGNLWSGSSWGTNENFNVGQRDFSSCAEGDDVHVAYISSATANAKAYRKRTYGVGWGSEEIVKTEPSLYVGQTLCVDLVSGDLYYFWGEGTTVYYSKKPSGGSWSSPITLASGESYLRLLSINAFKRVWSVGMAGVPKIGVVWVRGELSPYYVRYAVLSVAAAYKLNLKIMDWDLTDAIPNAYVYLKNDTSSYVKTSDSNGWANWTGISGTVYVNVSYFGFWVNGTFSVSVSADTTLNVHCNLYDAYIKVLPNNQQGILYTANVTVFNGTSVQGNKIATSLTNETGYVYLTNLPNNTLTFTVYAGSSYSTIIYNDSRTLTSDEQVLSSAVCNQNYGNVSIPWEIVMMPIAMVYFSKKAMASKNILKRNKNQKDK